MKNRLFLIRIEVSIVAIFFLVAPLTNQNLLAIPQVLAQEVGASRVESWPLREWSRNSAVMALEQQFQTYQRAREARDDVTSSLALRRASELRQMLGDYEQILIDLREAVRLSRRSSDIAGEAESLALLSSVEANLGLATSSKKNLNLALKLLDDVPTVSAKAVVNLYLGDVYCANQDISGLTLHYQNALDLYEASGDQRGVARTLFLSAYGALARDEVARAVEIAERAILAWRNLNEKRGEALSLAALGVALLRDGRNSEALEKFKAAELLFPVDLNNSEKAVLLYNIGRTHQSFGDCSRSVDYFKQSLDLLVKEKNVSLQIGNLWTLASEMNACGGPASVARDYANRALSLATQLEKKDDIGSAYTTLGEIAFSENDFPAALRYHTKAKELFDRSRYYLSSGRAMLSLGNIHEGSGNLEEARKQYRESQILNRRIRNSYGESDALYGIARIAKKLGNYPEAVQFLDSSLTLVNQLSRNVEDALLSRTYRESVFSRYELSINLLMRSRRIEEQLNALTQNERARSHQLLINRTLANAGWEKSAPQELVASERRLRQMLSSKTNELTAAISADGSNEEIEQIETQVRRIESDLEQTRVELKRSSPVYSSIKNPEPFDVGDFQANVLDEESVLLEFSLGAEESYLWTVSKAEVSAFYLPSRERIEGRVDKLRGLLAQTGLKEGETVEDYQRRSAEAEAEYRKEARALSEDLLGQAVDKIAGKRLIVVADGKLLQFPIGSLPMPGTVNDEPILLTNEVVYEPSAAALKILKSERTGGKKPEKDLLVFADPVFSKTDERLTGLERDETGLATTLLSVFRSGGQLEKLPRLPASEEEAESIRDVVGSGQTTVRSGFAANRNGVINSDIENYKALHFATHGLIDEKRPELSGILLSLYDESGKASDGGMIRLQDVYGLNLRSDLVVLSACETGIGKEIKGEGLMSLNNAFLQAGAKTVVSSLWKVDDTATKQLMTNFYQGIATEGLTASAALRQAQIAMYKNPRYGSPFFWAAFTVQGDYQRVPSIGGGFSFWIVGLLMVSIAAFGIYLYRRTRLSRA